MTPYGTTKPVDLKHAVRQHYGQIAATVLTGPSTAASCCGPAGDALPGGFAAGDVIPLQAAASCCSPAAEVTTASLLYASDDLTDLPETVTAASLGCGNPTAIAALQPGQVVLDLGSGGGIDCFLAARQVGPAGRVIGLDMTPAMLELAERNKAQLGAAAANVRFVRGEIEAIPLPDAEVDVIISNCVINLAPDKDAVFREAWRVLRPGGYLAVSDTVALQPFTAEMARDVGIWSACIAGSLDVDTYVRKLQASGFERVSITGVTPTDFGISQGVDDAGAAAAAGIPGGLESWIASARIVAYKPLSS
jgi:SAM-dependent methyltransferase